MPVPFDPGDVYELPAVPRTGEFIYMGDEMLIVRHVGWRVPPHTTVEVILLVERAPDDAQSAFWSLN
ncbi:hypothetical protein [Kineococcus sp. SYSU DK003]|uniref:hypothetical protein n=1 Tax=Kineococcus sp. SYSU DK003 TaxID=3383124 RepID=UPI003D7CB262